ncbi:hypothetical protein HMI55_004920 [Coelomomyces lativittatus]|nr:hypothetical protein HMI55_004920 [Coelomomyces lativittatus]
MNSQATNDLSLMGEVTSSRPYLRPTRPAPPPPTTSLPYSRKNSNAHVNEGNIGRMAIEDYSNLFPIEPKEEEEEEEETPSHKTVSRTSSTYLFNTPPLSRSNSRSSSHSSISPGFFEEFHRKEEETKKAERNAVLEDQILGIENENEHYQELGNENKQHEERGNEQATIHDTKKNSRPRQFKKFLKKFIPKPLKKKKNKRNPNSTADSEDN